MIPESVQLYIKENYPTGIFFRFEQLKTRYYESIRTRN